MPASMAPERIQAEQILIALFAPELAGALEATFILAAGRLDSAAADGSPLRVPHDNPCAPDGCAGGR